jgi:hypothetical protein
VGIAGEINMKIGQEFSGSDINLARMEMCVPVPVLIYF